MNDNDELFRPPPERDVSPQLRARVLHGALDAAAPARQRRRLVGPVLAGLSAAAVVIAVIAFLGSRDHGDSGDQPPIAGHGDGNTPTVLVPPHAKWKVDLGQLGPVQTEKARTACRHRSPATQVGLVRANRLQNSPIGPVPVMAYAKVGNVQQYLCTPYAVTFSGPGNILTSSSDPVVQIKPSRVQVTFPDADTGDTWYVDGTWFSVSSSIASIEVRINVGDQQGRWYSTQRAGSIMFAPAWHRFTPDQLDRPVVVQYRAISVDGNLVRVPGLGNSDVTLSTVDEVTPAPAPFPTGS